MFQKLLTARPASRGLYVAIIATFCTAVLAPSARAATFNIANGDVTALASAISTSNGNGTVNTINLASNGTYTLTAVTGTTDGGSGLPVVSNASHTITINGNGSTIARSSAQGTPEFRIFTVGSGASLDLESLTLSGGKVSGKDQVFLQSSGGAILVLGSLTANTCTFSGNTVTTSGGAIFNEGSSTFTGCTFNGNTDTGNDNNQGEGGAIMNWGETGDPSISPSPGGASLTIEDCGFSNNSAGGYGAVGMSAWHGSASLSITDSSFIANHAVFVGAVGADGSNGGDATFTIIGSTFTNNTAGEVAGAIGYQGIGTDGPTGIGSLEIADCTLSGNSVTGGIASQGGGGAIWFDGTSTVTGCTITGNSTDGVGGGIFNGDVGDVGDGSATATITGCTIDHNSATAGGGVYNNKDGNTSTITLVNCTLADNEVSGSGGALFSDGGAGGTAKANLSDCTFSGNTSDAGGVVVTSSSGGTSVLKLDNTILTAATGVNLARQANAGTITSLGYNISNDNGGGFLTATGDQINTDPKLDANGLQDNGGLTDTIKLLPGSPAIDKGNAASSIFLDQTGYTRRFDDTSVANISGGDASDIGAYESRPANSPDNTKPLVSITSPANGSSVGATSSISGSASDPAAPVTFLPGLYRMVSNIDGLVNIIDVLVNAQGVATAAPFVFNGNAGEIQGNISTTGAIQFTATDPQGDPDLIDIQLANKNGVLSGTGQYDDTDHFPGDPEFYGMITVTRLPDLQSGVSTVSVSLSRTVDGDFWDGKEWVTGNTPLPAEMHGSTWLVGVLADLAVGTYNVSATATDTAGNSNATQASFTVTTVADKTGPSATITVPKKNSTVTSLPGLTATATDAGSGVAHVDFYLLRNSDSMWWNGTVWGTTATALPSVAGSNNTYTKTGGLPTPTSTDSTKKLTDGIYTVYARAYDNLNNLTTVSSQFQMQTPIKVSCTITIPKKNSTINGLAGFQAKTTDSLGGTGVAKVDFYLLRNSDSKWWSGTTWGTVATGLPGTQSPSGTWTRTSTLPSSTATDLTKKLGDGIYTVYARPTDTHGVVSTFSSLFQQQTPIKVSCTIIVPKRNSTVNGIPGLQAKTTDSDGGSGVKSVDFYLLRNTDSKWWSGTAWGTVATALPATQSPAGTWTKTGGMPAPTSTDLTKKLTDGIYTVYARPTDIHGAVSTFSSLFQQQTPITVHATITVPAKNATVAALPSLAATTTDSLGGTGVAKVDFYLARNSDGKFWSGTAWVATATALPSTKGSASGSWVKTTGLPSGSNLADGIYTVYARPTDIHGVVTTFSSLFQVKVAVSPFVGFYTGTFTITAGPDKGNISGQFAMVIGPDGVAGSAAKQSGQGWLGYSSGTANLSTGDVVLNQVSHNLTGLFSESVNLSLTASSVTGSGTISLGDDDDPDTGTIAITSRADIANASVGLYTGTYQESGEPGGSESGICALFVDNSGFLGIGTVNEQGNGFNSGGNVNFSTGAFTATGTGINGDTPNTLTDSMSGTFSASGNTRVVNGTFTTSDNGRGTVALTRVAPSQ